MLIFDRFQSIAEAVNFMSEVGDRFDLSCFLFNTVAAAQAADPIPVELAPLIIHVERPDCGDIDEEIAIEEKVRLLAEEFGGTFVGT